jgi:diguanylate cyclase (GGDEF)-like protein
MVAAVSSGIRRSTGPGWALRRDFARVLVLAVVLPALALAAFFGWNEADARRAEAGERLRSIAQWAAQDLDDYLAVHGAAVQVLADRRSEERDLADTARWRADLRRLRSRYPAFASMLATDARGVVVAGDPLPRRRDGAQRIDEHAFFDEVRRNGNPQWSDAYRGSVAGHDAIVSVTMPLRAGGRFAGVVSAAVDVAAFVGMRADRLRTRGCELLLLDRRNQVIFASPGVPHAPLDTLDARQLVLDGDAPAATQVLHDVLRDGGDAYANAITLREGWRLVVMLPKSTLDAQLLRGLLTMLGLIAVVAAAVLAIAWWQMRRLGESVQRLLDRMQRFALDHASAPMAHESMPRELAPLADALNQLSERLGDAYRATSASLAEQRRLRESLEHVVDAREREIASRTRELRGAVAELDRLSRTDALTGCLNYRGFREVTAQLWRDAGVSNKPLAALALDIDYFKAYNDRYGHPRGDAALSRFAGAVRSALYRGEDVVVRPGGEEFIVFLPDTTLEQAVQVAERIVASVRQADIVHAGSPLGVLTVSIGVSCRMDDDGSDPEVMLTRADAALYRAKGGGRNRVSL